MKKPRWFSKKGQVVFWLLLLFSLLGFRYPVVGRDAVWNDMPRSLLWWSLGLAVCLTTWCVYLTTSFAQKPRILAMLWFCCYVLGWLMALGLLFTVNGLFDRSMVRTYATRIVDQRIVAARRDTEYYLVVTDWRNSAGTVTLNVNEATYDRCEQLPDQPGGKVVHVETQAGLLGYERLIALH